MDEYDTDSKTMTQHGQCIKVFSKYTFVYDNI